MKKRLGELAGLFIKMGFTAFGGPAAHIAFMEDEIVRKRKWMDDQHFLDLVGATNLIPGPNSTEMAIHCGHERAGIPGLFVAGLSFILPACLITGILAFFYKQYGALPEVEPFLVGIKPAVLMIIAGAVLKLGKKAIKNKRLAIIGLAAAAGGIAGGNTALLIIGLGLVGLFWFETMRRREARALAVEPVSLLLLFFVFFKIGALLFGSGYVLIAYFETELIENLGLLTRAQLLDAIAVGQFTPGPLLSSATFVGYLIGGIPGAAVATLGMVLPSTLFVWILNPLVPRMRGSKIFGNFLDAVNAAAVGVMAGVAILLGRQVLVSWQAVLIAALAAITVFGPKKISSVWIVLGGSLIGRLLLEIPL
jgi:chromate transporter